MKTGLSSFTRETEDQHGCCFTYTCFKATEYGRLHDGTWGYTVDRDYVCHEVTAADGRGVRAKTLSELKAKVSAL